MEEPAFLMAVNRVVRGIEVEHDLGWRITMRGDEGIRQDLVDRPRPARLGLVLEAHSVGALASARSCPVAVCTATSWRSSV